MKKSLCFFLAIIQIHLLIGQKPVWKTVDTEISKNFITFEVDSLGFLWALADDGLYKYDGYQLTQFLSTPIKEISFLCMDKSKENELIIGTSHGSLIFFNPYFGNHQTKKWIKYPITYIDCPYKDSRCLTISYGSGARIIKGGFDKWLSADSLLVSNEVYSGSFIDNVVWLATDQGIQQFTFLKDGIKSQIIDEKGGLSDIITTQIEQNDKLLWVSNFDKGVERISNDMEVSYYPLPDQSKIYQLKWWEERLLVATESGLFVLENKLWKKIYPESGNEKVHAFTIDQKSNLWLSGQNGKLVGASLLFERIPTNFSQIQALHSFNDHFYIGTKDGLFKKNGDSWTKILSTNITVIQSFNDDFLWVGTYTEGFLIIDANDEIIYKLKSWFGYENQSVFGIFVEQDKTLITSLSGLSVFKYNTKMGGGLKVNEAEKLPGLSDENYIYQTVSSQNKYYFATDKKGLRAVIE